MRVLVIGANGQLGSDLTKVLQGSSGFEVVPLTHSDVEVANAESVRTVVERYSPEVVVSTAAYHKLEVCEDDAQRTFEVNALGTRNLALACQTGDATLVFLSTDYVFGGDLYRKIAYTEDDPPAPINVYGVSKLAGESFVRYLLRRHIIMRVSGLYGISGSSGKGGNFVELMLRLAKEGREIKVVDDQTLTPTYTMDVARQVERLLRLGHSGLFHATSEGQCTWYQFAAEIFRQAGVHAQLLPTTTVESGAKVRRPRYSVLDNVALRTKGLDVMRPWQEALAAYLLERRSVGKE